LGGLLLAGAVSAQTAAAGQKALLAAPLRVEPQQQQRSLTDWLERLQQASRVPSYSGTYVVSSATGTLSSAHIQHYRDGGMQIERVEVLTGEPRVTFRHNQTVLVYWPAERVVRSEQREPKTAFPDLLQPNLAASVEAFYQAKPAGQERVAGTDADIVVFKPRDKLRYGYRIWSERQTGMIVKIQTLDERGHILEQSAFSEITFQPVRPGKLLRAMADRRGYRSERAGERFLTTAQQEGWTLSAPVAGFTSQVCYRRPMPGEGKPMTQWVFSDGLATVSLFMGLLDPGLPVHEGASAIGATHVLTRRMAAGGQTWWLTAVGEVPMQTLQEFAARLQPGH